MTKLYGEKWRKKEMVHGWKRDQDEIHMQEVRAHAMGGEKHQGQGCTLVSSWLALQGHAHAARCVQQACHDTAPHPRRVCAAGAGLLYCRSTTKFVL